MRRQDGGRTQSALDPSVICPKKSRSFILVAPPWLYPQTLGLLQILLRGLAARSKPQAPVTARSAREPTWRPRPWSAPTRPKLSLWPSGGAAWDPGRHKRLGRSRHHALKRGPPWTGGAKRHRPARQDSRATSALLSGGPGCGGSQRLGREGGTVRGPPEERTPQFKLSGEAAAQRTRAPTAAGSRCLGRSERRTGSTPGTRGAGTPWGRPDPSGPALWPRHGLRHVEWSEATHLASEGPLLP
ncbi:hypothetical protein NDU88_004614 [Pleurodeles waltl]|uniref:Uncharacterized protein n=1 Tax=Pleurodeles waltl TaxID=8319 RepID=A0AAV7UGL6_PLEWA|nr:hypothetical protein NDU88_004614 [Pleurodeles waltl]